MHVIKNEEDVPIINVEAELVLDCLDFDIFIISNDFKILYVNKTFLGRVNTKKEDVIGHHCYEISHNLKNRCEPPNDPCPIDRVKRTGKPEVEVHTHFSKDNKKELVNVTAALIKDWGMECYIHISLPAKAGVDKDASMKSAMEKTVSVLDIVSLYQKQMKELKEKRDILEKTKEELERKVDDLEKFNNLTVGRELKMIELKEKIMELENKYMGK